MSNNNTQSDKSYVIKKIPLQPSKPKRKKQKSAAEIIGISIILVFAIVLSVIIIKHNGKNKNTIGVKITNNTNITTTYTQPTNKTQNETYTEPIETEPTIEITEPATTEPIDPRPDLFNENITFRMNHIVSTDYMPYTLISPMENGKPIENEPLPLIVWLHGSGEKNVDPSTFLSNGLPAVFQNWPSNGFRAYIICPQLDGNYNPGAWCVEQSATNLNNLLTQFISENNIDRNNIIIMGHSLGGQGALYMAHHFNGDQYPALFTKCVVLSGYNPNKKENDPVDIREIAIPIIAYVGMKHTGEDSSSVNFSLSKLAPIIGESSVISLPTTHGELPRVVLSLDENNNNRADIIEWCFDTNHDNKIDDGIITVNYTANIANTKSICGTYNSVPLYFQTDYPETPYSEGTLATSGCGISCFSMVATYLLDKEYTPNDLARFTDSGSNNAARFERAAQSLGISWTKSYNWNKTVNALKNGYIAIALVNDKTPFTEGGHFIVLTGITSDGKILVNDPNENNYRRMKKQYETGFEQSDISCGFSGAWLFKKD